VFSRHVAGWWLSCIPLLGTPSPSNAGFSGLSFSFEDTFFFLLLWAAGLLSDRMSRESFDVTAILFPSARVGFS